MNRLMLMVLLGAVAGCNNQTPPTPPAAPAPPTPPANAAAAPHGDDDEHEHKPGTKGGYIIDIGGDHYHAEVVVENNDVLKLYMLDRDEKDMAVETQSLTAMAQLKIGMGKLQQFDLKPAPLPTDKQGTTSLFTGTVPESLAGKSSEVVIQEFTIHQKPYRVEFEIYTGLDAPTDDEKALFLTPGGKYTQADIVANGNMTGSQKFRRFKPKHDFRPKPGDKICPITMTKANPECTWIVGGKTYEFCCPPCVEEFVLLAKEQPDEIKEPESYVKEAKPAPAAPEN